VPADRFEIENEERKRRYEAYVRERDALRHDSLNVSERYDKAILLLGGGALALSLTFIEVRVQSFGYANKQRSQTLCHCRVREHRISQQGVWLLCQHCDLNVTH
jgi:hypothetical protein